MLGRQVQARLHFSGEFAAHYLAGAGRGSAWRHLVQLIDSIELTPVQSKH